MFDQNLPHRFVRKFAGIFPGSKHVKDVSLETASDRKVWDYARNGGFTVVSKDADFH